MSTDRAHFNCKQNSNDILYFSRRFSVEYFLIFFVLKKKTMNFRHFSIVMNHLCIIEYFLACKSKWAWWVWICQQNWMSSNGVTDTWRPQWRYAKFVRNCRNSPNQSRAVKAKSPRFASPISDLSSVFCD